MDIIKLKNSILAANPNADSTILEDLCNLTQKYQLKWVPNKDGGSAYFVMSHLSKVKGLDLDDYKSHWVKLTECGERTSSESLSGRGFKLEGEKLATFKKNWQEMWGESLGRINSIWVGDWTHAYSYLTQGTTQAAKDFQTLGAKAIGSSIKKDIEELTAPIIKVDRTLIYNSGYSKEEHLQRDLCYLAAHSPYKLSAEISVEDYPGSRTQHRRFDLVHVQPHKSKGKVVTTYELKKDIITLEDLVMAVEAKRYPDLIKLKYGTSNIKLIMVAPFGGTEEALVRCQQYDDVEIWTVRKLSLFLLEKARKYHPTDSYFVDKMLVEDNDTVKKLLTIPQLPQEESKVLHFPTKKLAA
ncbi:hypothetical protein ACQFX9_14325 [Aliinostoc sp. HNIBRCY26]|uniref:hypothetical protein n=1 Tax=Aliinostoc sp. HNIBRCY26 TaxID=3418997 RepID=UPI003D05CD0B